MPLDIDEQNPIDVKGIKLKLKQGPAIGSSKL